MSERVSVCAFYPRVPGTMLILDLMIGQHVPETVFWEHADRTALSHHLLGRLFHRALWFTEMQSVLSCLLLFIHSSTLSVCQLHAVDCAGHWGRCQTTSPCPQVASSIRKKPVKSTGSAIVTGYAL